MELAKVSKDSFVYKVAYSLSRRSDHPDRGDLCTLFWRFLLFAGFMWPITLACLLVANLFTIPLGYLTVTRETDGIDFLHTKAIPGWPWADDFGPVYKNRVFPALIVYFFYWLGLFEIHWELGTYVSAMVLIFALTVSFIMLVVLGEKKVKEKFLSFKEKYCKLLEYT